MPGDYYIPFSTVAIVEDGIRFSLNILFREVMQSYKLNPIQLAINIFRKIMDVAELIHRHGKKLTLRDVQYYYTICDLSTKKSKTFYLKPQS